MYITAKHCHSRQRHYNWIAFFVYAITGLYIFMSMATKSSNDYNLEKVYEFAMMNLNSILQRELPARNSKHSGSKLTTDRRNTKRMKFV